MSENLGSAELSLGVDLKPLDADLSRAKQHVAAAVGEMQAIFDTLDAKVDLTAAKLGALGALGNVDRVGGTTVAQQPSTAVREQMLRNEIWGVRGPQHPGSLTNPIVTVQAAAKFFPMGSQAAAVGESNVQDAERTGESGDQGGLAAAAEMAALTRAVEAMGAGQGALGMAATVGNGREEPGRPVVALSDPDAAAIGRMADALERLAGHGGGGGGGSTTIVGGAGGRGGQGGPGGAGGEGEGGPGGAGGEGEGGPGGGGSRTTIISEPAGENTVRLDGPQYAGLISAITGSGGGGGLGYLSKRVDVFYHSSSEDNTGGGKTGLLGLLGLASGAFGAGPGAGGGGLLGGAGILGMAGIGTAASFAGLGFEHLLFTALGLAGSAGAAAGGGGLLAAGALGVGAVGAGSDLGVLKSTIGDTQTLSQAITAVSTAEATYGKNSSQATAATKALNVQIAALGNTAGVQAEVGLANAGQALDHYFDLKTSAARVQAVNILMQGVNAGYTFVPLIAQAALRNLTMINQDLKPLFSWLTGPDGVGIFNDLENKFAKDLPTAMQAFDNAVEIVLRVVDLASGHTGGFIHWLDNLATRLNSMSNPQLEAWIGRMINDFHVWGTFVKLLVEDIADLFSKDVGTGNAIIQALTGMLEKLHEYENSASGSAQLTNIFMIHKTEILELLSAIGSGIKSFADIYMAIAPPMVTFMNDVALPFLNDVAKVVAAIAGSSHAAALALGGLLVLWKSGQMSAVLGALRGVAGAGATGAAASAGTGVVEVAGAGAAGAITGTAGVAAGEAALSTGPVSAIAAALAAGGPAIAAAATAALPFVLTAGGLVVVAKVLSSVFPGSDRGAVATPQGTTNPTTVTNAFARAGAPGSAAATSLVGQTLNVQEVGKFADWSAERLKQLIAEMKQASGVTLNGVAVSKNQLIAMAQAALKTKDDFNKAFDEIWAKENQFFLDNSRSLPALRDDFNTIMRGIASIMGTQSNEGQKEVAVAVAKMVAALTQGMLDGKVSVTQGMAELKTVLHTGMADNAIDWNTDWHDMMSTVDTLYSKHKIDTATYLADLRQINAAGQERIAADTKATNTAMYNYLTQQEQTHFLTHGQFLAKWHAQQQQANQTEQTDMTVFTDNMAASMVGVTSAGATGVQDLIDSLNSALKLLGAAQLTGLQVAVMKTNTSTTPGGLKHGATGMKVNEPQYVVGEEGSAHPEYVLATNPAYRQRNLGLWAAAGHDLGIPGFATGGYMYPIGSGATTERTDQGKDFGGAFNVAALGPAQILDASLWPGWPGTGGVVYRLTGGSRAGSDVYVMEDFAAAVAAGDTVRAGQIIGRATGGPSGIETGWANGSGSGPLTPYNGAPDGTATVGGQSFAAFIAGLAHGILTGGISGGVPTITAPGVSGKGPLANMVRAALGKSATAANAYLSKFAPPAATGATGATGGTVGATVGDIMAIAQQASIAAGVPWDPSIVALLLHAESAGGVNEPASGSLSATGPFQVIPGTFAAYEAPGHGNINNPVDNADAAFRYIKARYGTMANLEAVTGLGTGRYVGYRHGGILGYAAGGVPGMSEAEQQFLAKNKRSAKHRPAPKPPKPKTIAGGLGLAGLREKLDTIRIPTVIDTAKRGALQGVLGAGGPFPLDPSDLGSIGASLDAINALAGGEGTSIEQGGDALATSNLVQWDTTLWETDALYPPPNFSSWDSPGDFVIQNTTDAAGNPIAPYISGNIGQVYGQLSQIAGYQGRLVGDLVGVENATPGVEKGIVAAIKLRVAYVAKIKKRVADNVKKINAMLKQIKDLQDQIAKAKDKIAKAKAAGKPDQSKIDGWRAQIAAEQAKKKPKQSLINHLYALIAAEYAKHPDAAMIKGWDGQIKGWDGQIEALQDKIAPIEAENMLLGGSKTSLGTTGELGTIEGQLGAAAGTGAIGAVLGNNSSAAGLYALLSAVQGWDTQIGTDAGPGDLATQNLQLQQYQLGLAALGPGADATLATAAAAAAPAAAPATAASTDLTALLEQQNAQLAEQLMVSQAQYAVLAALPPFAGTFHSGGVVPGPMGEERMALVRAGERISTAGGGQPVQVQVIVKDGAVDPGKIACIANGVVQQAMRRPASNATRRLPSTGGGQLASRGGNL